MARTLWSVRAGEGGEDVSGVVVLTHGAVVALRAEKAVHDEYWWTAGFFAWRVMASVG